MLLHLPAYAARLLAPGESVRHVTRPRWVSLRVLVVLGGAALAVIAFAILIREPGFIGLLLLPALPLIGVALAGLTRSPVVFVTDRRVISALRFQKPLVINLEELRALRVKQKRLGRLLGWGDLSLLVKHPDDPREDVFLSYTVPRLRDPRMVADMAAEAVRALQKDVSLAPQCKPAGDNAAAAPPRAIHLRTSD